LSTLCMVRGYLGSDTLFRKQNASVRRPAWIDGQ
jgi:hypothetical protein